MRTEFLDAARAELVDAIEFYNCERAGLGYEFAAEVKRTIQRIAQHPDAWQYVSDHVRRCRCKRFPYAVLYTKRADVTLVVAVMHTRRDPESWKSRVL